MIAVIDYGLGNVGSIQNMLIKVGVNRKDIVLAKCKEDLKNADKLILPGVGNFDMGMKMLQESGMRETIDNLVLNEHKPILGICLGMQMLGEKSEEGVLPGLGYVPFSCVKFNPIDKNLKVPHMGWDYVNIIDKKNRLVKNARDHMRFYFVHSYYAVCKNQNDILMTCDYSTTFVAAVNHDNIYGTQFHPEKSHKYGMIIFNNFVKEV